MWKRLKGMSLVDWLKLAGWTVVGTLGCVGFAVVFNWFLFRSLGEPALGRAIFSALVVPVMLAGPLLFHLILKLYDLASANRSLDEAASIDSLTGCLNRGAFTALVEDWIAEDASHLFHRSGAFFIVDVDWFKTVNDRFGHLNGDEALRTIACAIVSAARSGDLVGRMGGEEFAAFLPGLIDAAPVAERIRKAVEAVSFAPDGTPCHLTVSIGGTTFDGPVPFGELYRTADARLFAAKRFGRNRVVMDGSGSREPALKPAFLH